MLKRERLRAVDEQQKGLSAGGPAMPKPEEQSAQNVAAVAAPEAAVATQETCPATDAPEKPALEAATPVVKKDEKIDPAKPEKPVHTALGSKQPEEAAKEEPIEHKAPVPEPPPTVSAPTTIVPPPGKMNNP